jgi:tetratricopeptide (TPR) repeat protein
MRLLLLVSLLATCAPACRSPYGTIERGEARPHLDEIEAEIARGDFAKALAHLEAVHAVEGLEPDLRAREERLIDEAAAGRFAELEGGADDALEDLFVSKLPERVRARAGVLAAQDLLERGSRIRAFRMVKKVDEALPNHHERVLAGEIVAAAGLALIGDERRYNLLFRYRSRGVQALEYLVLRYPLDPHCPEAFYALSQSYERRGNFDEAIARTEDLLLYHPQSPFSVAAAARLPYLRLIRLQRDDYDRGELLRARAELASWSARDPGHELAPWVQELERECDARLVRSDLYLADYYEKTGVPAGERMHAERARALAQEAGLTGELSRAETILEGLAPTDGSGTPR